MNNQPDIESTSTNAASTRRTKLSPPRPPRSSAPNNATREATTKVSAKPDRSKPDPLTKTAAILVLLRRKNGALIAELQKATGWQPHSVRGFLSGTVKTKLGLALRSERTEQGERRYTIAKR